MEEKTGTSMLVTKKGGGHIPLTQEGGDGSIFWKKKKAGGDQGREKKGKNAVSWQKKIDLEKKIVGGGKEGKKGSRFRRGQVPVLRGEKEGEKLKRGKNLLRPSGKKKKTPPGSCSKEKKSSDPMPEGEKSEKKEAKRKSVHFFHGEKRGRSPAWRELPKGEI